MISAFNPTDSPIFYYDCNYIHLMLQKYFFWILCCSSPTPILCLNWAGLFAIPRNALSSLFRACIGIVQVPPPSARAQQTATMARSAGAESANCPAMPTVLRTATAVHVGSLCVQRSRTKTHSDGAGRNRLGPKKSLGRRGLQKPRTAS